MSYHGLSAPPLPPAAPFTPTTAFAQSVDPYSWRMSPPGAIFAPYGWRGHMTVGMPANYTHHIGYERVPVRRRARRVGFPHDRLSTAGVGRAECIVGGRRAPMRRCQKPQPVHSMLRAQRGMLGSILAVL